MNGATAQGFEASLENDFSFPAENYAKGDLIRSIKALSLRLTVIIENVKEAIKVKSVRVKSVGMGSITHYLRHEHTPQEVFARINIRLERALEAKSELSRVEQKVKSGFGRIFGLLIHRVRKETPFCLNSLMTYDPNTSKSVLADVLFELVMSRENLNALAPVFEEGYRVLGSFEDFCLDKMCDLLVRHPEISIAAAEDIDLEAVD
ncbi:hypothetical protein DRE_00211 [Drechslerella stenobrocha 248]|uniref:Uncharacterized protein n=1 Tax=Drechslerella stenobrocha 248 TaxID=1043628 RepID=W7HXH3_9PEZI|nr:hypothetical protein DRE_00211 [Drechslerella stenobrocha 248]